MRRQLAPLVDHTIEWGFTILFVVITLREAILWLIS